MPQTFSFLINHIASGRPIYLLVFLTIFSFFYRNAHIAYVSSAKALNGLHTAYGWFNRPSLNWLCLLNQLLLVFAATELFALVLTSANLQ